MQSRHVHASVVRGATAFSIMMVVSLAGTPAGARAQGEFTLGPFLGFNTTDGGHPSSAGLQTVLVAGPVGVRLSGFTSLESSSASSVATGEPRYGADADLMLVLDLTSREMRSVGVGLAPYVFAGRGLTIHNDPYGYDGSRAASGWSYGAGLLVPLGQAELSGEIRQRPAGYIDPGAGDGSLREYRVGLSLRLGNLFGRSVRNMPTDSKTRSSRRRASDAAGVLLGTVGEVAGAAPTGSAARVIPTAERYLGTPYRYGGTSPITGFDCSGFVQYVFAKNNVRLPRTSRQQAKVGAALPRNWRSLSPGDLVMFAERGAPISHVAIYAGNNRIIHATSSGGEVRYDDLGTGRGQWFVEHMVAARRVVPDGRGLVLDLVKTLDAKTLVDTALDLGDFAPISRKR